MSSRDELIREIVGCETRMHHAVGYAEPQAFLGSDLTMGQVKVLFLLLASHQGASMSALARTLQVSVATASQLVERLVRQQLVTRTEDPVDRRCVNLALSPQGSEIARSLHEDSRVRTSRLLSVMTHEELSLVLRAMKAMIRASERLAAQ